MRASSVLTSASSPRAQLSSSIVIRSTPIRIDTWCHFRPFPSRGGRGRGDTLSVSPASVRQVGEWSAAGSSTASTSDMVGTISAAAPSCRVALIGARRYTRLHRGG